MVSISTANNMLLVGVFVPCETSERTLSLSCADATSRAREEALSLRQPSYMVVTLYERRHLALVVGAAAAALTLGLVYRRRRTRHLITVIRTASEAQRIVEQWYDEMIHDNSSERVLGLDVEWRSGSQRSAAVLQLSRGTETIVLQLQ